MNVSLTPELERLVNEKVESGLYQTASEVVREALRLLKERDQAREQLRADVQAGFDQLERGEGRTTTRPQASISQNRSSQAVVQRAPRNCNVVSVLRSRRAGPRGDLVLCRRGCEPDRG